jgi:dolichol-phosphate mannosyltransferase
MLYNWLLRVIVRTQIQDNLGGYWLTRAKLVKALPMDQIFFGYGEYYFRMLHYLQHEGASIVEVPAKYMVRKTGNSKSRFVRMLFSYTVAALKLRGQVRKSLAVHRGDT